MTKSDRADRCAEILNSTDFQRVVEAYRARLTRKVMAASTSDEERADALAHYHVVDAVLIGLANEAVKTEK